MNCSGVTVEFGSKNMVTVSDLDQDSKRAVVAKGNTQQHKAFAKNVIDKIESLGYEPVNDNATVTFKKKGVA